MTKGNGGGGGNGVEKEAHAHQRLINPSVHEALIKLIPIQAQKIRQKAVARMSQPETSPRPPLPPPKHKPKPKTSKKPGILPRAVRWEEEDPQELKRQEEFDKIWENDCESRARACEDKLSEKLSQCQLPSPNASRLNACLEVLREVRVVCPPFSRVLGDIFEELELALFCNVAHKDKKTTPVPYVNLVQRFETEIKEKEESQNTWKDSLFQYQSHIEQIEQDMEVTSSTESCHSSGVSQSLTLQVTNADVLNKNLTASLEAATHSLHSADEQVSKSKEKLLTLRKELKDARGEVRKSKSFEVQLQNEKNLQQQDMLRAEYAQLVTELQHFQTFLDTARSQINESVSKADYLAMKAQMLELQQRPETDMGEAGN